MAIAVILLFSTMAIAIDWYTANQITVEWDAVAKIAPADTITYKVFYKKVGGTPVFVEETATLQSTITMTEEGKYYFGVSTKRMVEGEELESGINWSDTNGDSTPNPFGARYYTVPGSPPNLRIP